MASAKKCLRVRVPDHGPMIQDLRLMSHPTHPKRAFIGWKHDPTLGEEYVDPIDKKTKRTGGFVTTDKVVELPYDVHFDEYKRHVRFGDLDPADEATAAECDVPPERVNKGAVAPAPVVIPPPTAATVSNNTLEHAGSHEQ